MHTIDLTGKSWIVQQVGRKEYIPATVPGDIHLDLMAAKKIPDPFYRDNEIDLMWIGEKDWTYSREFTVAKDVIKKDKVLLRCNGLDTIATVAINGEVVGRTENMFRTWEWNIKGVLKAGKNEIEVRFDSVLPVGRRRLEKRNLRGGGGPIRIKGGNMIRKEPCNFGWDWGPRCVTCGIWRPISIVAFDVARIDAVQVQQVHKRSVVDLAIDITADVAGTKPKLSAKIELSYQGKIVGEVAVALPRSKASASIKIKRPELWWPAGMGDQPLYDLKVELCTEDGETLDTDEKRIGLRVLELIKQKDEWGESFHFAANGVPFFSKGGNWIPTDVFQPRVTEELYRHILGSCRDANMNMVRIWGGGIYEEDIFYEICDELGLCVWQEFMFSCAAYPTYNPEFMANVKVEAEQNVKRIRHHACITIYCGNNELEHCRLIDDDDETRMTWKEYKSLFDKLLPGIVRKLHPGVPYIPSSGHSPRGPRDDFNADWCGDAHLWSVWHGRKPFEWYRTANHRFCSEFGFQSFPEPKTTYMYTNKEERNINSYVMNHHQRSGNGNENIMHYMLNWYRLPTSFENTIWLSQIQQGMSIKYAVEHWRRNMPRCMGALYWQINDCWPVASWASLDSFGRWKALHYMAKRFFARELVSGLEDPEKGTVEIHVTNDNPKRVKAEVAWTITNTEGRKLDAGSKNVFAKANANAKVHTLQLKPLLDEHTTRDIMVWLKLKVDDKEVSSNFVTFDRPKNFSLTAPETKVKVKKTKDGQFDVTIKAKRPALWAWLELKKIDAVFSDNFFCIEAGESVTIRVKPTGKLKKRDIEKQLVVRSIYDTYQ